MRNRKRRDFIIVVDSATGAIQAIIEGLDEQKLSQTQLKKMDEVLLKKSETLSQKFSADTYNVILARASGVHELKQTFSRFLGWKMIKKERIVIT